MAHRFDGKPISSMVTDSLDAVIEAPSDTVILAFFVAEALRRIKLADTVLEMRQSPADWADFLVLLHGFLEEGPIGRTIVPNACEAPPQIPRP